MITIIDYGMGNLRSIQKTFERMEIPSIISSDPDEIEKAEKLVLPGVGHFARGMQKIRELGLLEILNRKVLQEKTPVLGICLGMQLFCKFSEEGNAEGLGWIDAHTVRFQVSDNLKYKIPHIGWNSLAANFDSPLLFDFEPSDQVYFVHSYHVVSRDTDAVLTTSTYDYPFVSAVQKGNIFGTQFHPEKSHKAGSRILKNFAERIIPV